MGAIFRSFGGFSSKAGRQSPNLAKARRDFALGIPARGIRLHGQRNRTSKWRGEYYDIRRFCSKGAIKTCGLAQFIVPNRFKSRKGEPRRGRPTNKSDRQVSSRRFVVIESIFGLSNGQRSSSTPGEARLSGPAFTGTLATNIRFACWSIVATNRFTDGYGDRASGRVDARCCRAGCDTPPLVPLTIYTDALGRAYEGVGNGFCFFLNRRTQILLNSPGKTLRIPARLRQRATGEKPN